MLNTIESWDAYYKLHPHMEPSSFAHWTLDSLGMAQTYPSNLIDVGCGNGRDALLFAKHAIQKNIKHIVCLDSSSEAIEAARSNLQQHKEEGLNYSFVVDDVCQYDFRSIDICYCRFFLHTIDKGTFDTFMSHLRFGTMFFAETRIVCPDVKGKRTNEPAVYNDENHYRRILPVDDLATELSRYIDIRYHQVGRFSPTPDDSPSLLRVYGVVK